MRAAHAKHCIQDGGSMHASTLPTPPRERVACKERGSRHGGNHDHDTCNKAGPVTWAARQGVAGDDRPDAPRTLSTETGSNRQRSSRQSHHRAAPSRPWRRPAGTHVPSGQRIDGRSIEATADSTHRGAHKHTARFYDEMQMRCNKQGVIRRRSKTIKLGGNGGIAESTDRTSP